MASSVRQQLHSLPLPWWLRSPGGRWGARRAGAALLVAVGLFAVVSPAGAAPPELLFQTPEGDVSSGGETGHMDNPSGVASSPVTGHVFVAEVANARISEFTAWGVFVKAWGWDVAPEGAPGDTPSDQFEICTVVCQKGTTGTGTGQFAGPTGAELDVNGIAVDAAGGVYVVDSGNHRVQKFDSGGSFVWAVGGLTDQSPDPIGAYLAYDPIGDRVVVGDKERILFFGPDGSPEGELDKLEATTLAEETVQSLAVDPITGALYVAFQGPGLTYSKADVHKLDPASGALLSTLPLPPPPLANSSPISLAVDGNGTVYAVYDPPSGGEAETEPKVLAFDSAGVPVISATETFAMPPVFPPGAGGKRHNFTGLGAGVACGGGINVYASYFSGGETPVSYLRGFGTPPIACEPPPPNPPAIETQYATSVEIDSAVLKAEINPRFWSDTAYRVQYGTEECSKGGCAEQPAPPGTQLIDKVTSKAVTTAGVLLTGLQPGTTYHYRFVAESGGGGPAFGEERTFRTFALPEAPAPCPSNEQFRTGAGAQLPDCRAYEMVSPLDKDNGDIITAINVTGFTTSLLQSSRSGERLTYSSATSFGGAEGAPFASQYLADRDQSQGWTTQPLSPVRTRPVIETNALGENEFKAFSEDLCMGWMRHDSDPPLEEKAIPEYLNLYRRDNCGPQAGSFEAVTPIKPAHLEPLLYTTLTVQGFSDDGTHTIFLANDNLAGTGAPNNTKGVSQLYEYTGGKVRYVCVLPSAVKSPSCSAGHTEFPGVNPTRTSSWQGAVSDDGARIFWTDVSSGEGKLYVRDSQGTLALADDTTTAVSEAAEAASKTSASHFWLAARDGSRAVFTTGGTVVSAGDLYTFDVDAGTTTAIAGEVMGVMGASEDARRIYFASREALTGAETNSNGDEAEAGEINLYLYEEAGESFAFIGGLAAADNGEFSPFHARPVNNPSRVSADGLHAAFVSVASLTGYDNTDALNGNADTEVFLYDADAKELVCISCNPSGARPAGRKGNTPDTKSSWVAAKIPTWERSLYPSRVLSSDGTRVYFESVEALSLRDTNGAQDVYQWEEAGSGSCEESDFNFAPASGGCIELISSGESPRDSSFVDADESGEDVFITTLSSLVSSDYGLVDVYDARVGGGFPQPSPPKPACEGEACQSPPAPPAELTPATSAVGRGNAAAPKPGCGKGRKRVVRKGKARCVKRQRASRKRSRAEARGGRR